MKLAFELLHTIKCCPPNVGEGLHRTKRKGGLVWNYHCCPLFSGLRTQIGGGGDKSGVWDHHIHNTLCKINNKDLHITQGTVFHFL